MYDWCIRNRGRTLPINGERRLKQPYTLANLENYPGTSVKIPGGLRLPHVHTKYYKDAPPETVHRSGGPARGT